jgi:hypothetical protein
MTNGGEKDWKEHYHTRAIKTKEKIEVNSDDNIASDTGVHLSAVQRRRRRQRRKQREVSLLNQGNESDEDDAIVRSRKEKQVKFTASTLQQKSLRRHFSNNRDIR